MLDRCAYELYDLYNAFNDCGIDIYSDILYRLSKIDNKVDYCNEVHSFWLCYIGG